MADDDKLTEDQQRVKDWMMKEFLPGGSRTATASPDERIAAATEYAAHHVGLISMKLTVINQALQKLARNT